MNFKAFLQKKGITEDAFSKMEASEQAKLHGEFLDEMAKTATENSDKIKELESSKSENEALKTEIQDLKATAKELGTKVTELSAVKGAAAKPDLMDSFKEQYEAAEKDGDFSIKDKHKIVIDVEKVTISSDVLSMTAVNSTAFPAAGSTQAIDGNIAVLNAQNLGFATYRKPYSPIMEVVDVMPLDSQNLLIVNETVTGDAAITPECTLKPIVKPVYSVQQASAAAVAAEWATTTQLRRFYPAIANRMRTKIGELVMDKTPASVLAAVVAGGSAFTANPALAINTDPNDYDALGAVLAQLQKLGFMPNAIVLSPEAWYRMVHTKATDGHYSVWNGNAISLVGEVGLNFQGRLIRWIIDPTIAADRFLVGDFMQSVKVGLDSELMYFETDGRTDAASTPASGLSRNIRTHVLERFVATLIPTPTAIGIVSDTFANVKTLITAE